MIRIALPAHLRTIARVDGEVSLEVHGAVTQRTVLDALESRFPTLRGTIRDHVTQQRRPFVRFFACQTDLSHESPDAPLPDAVVAGSEPFLVVGAVAGGQMLRILRSLFFLPADRRRRRPAVAPNAIPPERYADWFSDWSALWGVSDLSSRVNIVFSPRMRRALGRCSPRTGSIRLNPALLDAAPEELREVVCHEAAHAAVWLLYGRKARPHGREWKDLMRRAGYEPRVRWAKKDAAVG